MVFRVGPVGRGWRQDTGKRQHGHAYTRGIELPLVVSDHRPEGPGPAVEIMLLESQRETLVQLCIASERKLQPVRVVESQHFQKEAALHLWNQLFMMTEIGNTANCLWYD